MPRNIPQEILDQLSPEELEGMMDEDLVEEGEPDGTEAEITDEPPAAATVEKDEELDDDAAIAAATAEAAAAADAPAAAASAVVEGQQEDGDATAAPAPAEEPDEADVTPAWLLPMDVKQGIDELKAKRAELAEKADNGELTYAEHRKLADDIEDKLDALKTRQMAADIERTQAINKWGKETVPDFIKQNPEYSRSPALTKMLDEKVRELQAQSRNPLNPKLLEKAHAVIRREIFGEEAPRSATPAAGQQEQAKPKPAPVPKRPGMPPTLRDVPQADATEAGGGGEFGYLDRLMDTDSVAFENALAKLSEPQREKYLAQG